MTYSLNAENRIYSGIYTANGNSISRVDNDKTSSINFETDNEIDVEFDEEVENPKKTVPEMREEFEQIQAEQGFVGKTWDTIKNKIPFLSKIGMKGSDEIEEILAKAESGEISEEEAQEELEKYKSNQRNTTELVLDAATVGVVSAVCLLAGPLGWTAGAILGISFMTGAIARTALGAAEAATNDVKGDYTLDDACRDFQKGGIIGFFTGLGKVFKTKINGNIRNRIIKQVEDNTDYKNTLLSLISGGTKANLLKNLSA